MQSARTIVEILDGKLFATAPQVAEILNCDHRTVLRALELGQIPGLKTGVVWRIPTAWLREQALLGGGGDAAATG